MGSRRDCLVPVYPDVYLCNILVYGADSPVSGFTRIMSYGRFWIAGSRERKRLRLAWRLRRKELAATVAVMKARAVTGA